MRKVFAYLSQADFKGSSTPELIGEIFALLKKEVRNDDPYKETRAYYNKMFLNKLPELEQEIDRAMDDSNSPMQEIRKAKTILYLGTVLYRTSARFQEIYKNADMVIAKGQANYECLSDENKNIYFLLMTKCSVIASDIGVPEMKMICARNGNKKNSYI